MTASLGAIRAASATSVRVGDAELVLFAGCDYLGLAHHPRVIAALEQGLRDYGVSASASRATTGNTIAHEELERDLARFLGLEDALIVPDGYLSNVVVAQALPERIETCLVDRESHASIRDAVLLTGRTVHEYAFVDARAARARAESLGSRPFAVFTDGVFPVLRTVAPLKELLETLPKDGLLVVDDCHALGVVGARGRGSLELARISDPRVVVTGTLSKSLGVFGGYVAGAREQVDRARRQSRAFLASTPIPPALARAASAALQVVDSEPWRRARLSEHTHRMRALLTRLGRPVGDVPLPVFALQLEPRARMERVRDSLAARGMLVPCIDYPDGLGGYLRIALRADHTAAQVDDLITALTEVLA